MDLTFEIKHSLVRRARLEPTVCRAATIDRLTDTTRIDISAEHQPSYVTPVVRVQPGCGRTSYLKAASLIESAAVNHVLIHKLIKVCNSNVDGYIVLTQRDTHLFPLERRVGGRRLKG